ncbi:MAG: DUF3467 domain-containing protein [Saprospiraceae bacterium]
MADKKTPTPPQQQQVQFEMTEEIAEGIYSNLAVIAHSNSEFVIDFVRLLPNTPKAKVKARIVLTPQHAKRLVRALHENVQKYEAQFGSIKEPDGNNNNGPQFPPMSFTPTAQA